MDVFDVGDQRWIAFLLGIIFSTTGFTCYYYFNKSLVASWLGKKGKSENTVRKVMIQRFSGFTIFGAIPLVLYMIITGKTDLMDLLGAMNIRIVVFLVPTALLIIFVNYVNADTEINLSRYPEIRKKVWSLSLVLQSALTWIIYLLGYEFVFRALLFIPAMDLIGFWPAVALNLGIYSLVHIHKGPVEAFGSLALGFTLCIFVAITESFWIAWFVHVILALTNEWMSIHKNPEIIIVGE